MGRVSDYLEKKLTIIVNSWDDETLKKHTIAKGDAVGDYVNSVPSTSDIDSGRLHDLQTNPGGFIYKSEILQKKAYFFGKPRDREIVFTHNTIIDAAIKKIKKAITAVEPIFSIPSEEKEENPQEHEKAKNGWKSIYGREILAKAIEKSIKHGIVIYEPLDIPESDLEWYTNAPFFIRTWDEFTARGEPLYGMYTQYHIHPSNPELKDYVIDITRNTLSKHPRDSGTIGENNHHAGLFYDPENTDDHNGKPWFLGCWDNIQDYEAIKEARNSYDEQMGNGFMVIGVPSKDYKKVKNNVKDSIQNVRREMGLVIPIEKDYPVLIDFKGSAHMVDFNADLNDVRRDIIANIGLPERWLFGDSEGAMESSGKDRLQVHDEIKNLFGNWKRFIKLVLKYHHFIDNLDEVEIKAPYELQLTETEKAEVDNLRAQTLDTKAQFLTLDEIRDELGKKPVEPDELYNAILPPMPNDPNNPDNLNSSNENPLNVAKTQPKAEKTDSDPILQIPYLKFDSVVEKASYRQLQEWTGLSKDSIGKIKRNLRENKQTNTKTDSIMLDSVEVSPDIYISSGLIVPTQKKYYPEYKSNFIRDYSQLSAAFDRQKDETFPIGVYQSNGHDEGIDVGELAQFGETRLDSVDEQGIHGTTVYDLTKVDEILGKDNWIRKRLKSKKKIPTSVGLISVDVPIDNETKYELNHTIKSFIATEHPRNEDAGIE